MTPDQYRREGFREGIEAAAIEAENCGTRDQSDDCFVVAAAIRAIDVDEVLAGLTPAHDHVARLGDAARALGAMPEGYCFCSANRVGDDSKIHEPECADLRAALVAKENEQCQVSIGPVTGATTNGPLGSGAGVPAAVANSHTDAVARPVDDLTLAAADVVAWFDLSRPDLAGPRIRRLRAALAAMETDHD